MTLIVRSPRPTGGRGRSVVLGLAPGLLVLGLGLAVSAAGKPAPGQHARPSGPPRIVLTPNVIRFTVNGQDRAPEPQTVDVINAGQGILRWRARGTPRWLSVSPSYGREDGELQVTVDASSLGTGVHEGMITVHAPAAGDSPQRVKVIVEVRETSLYAGFRSSRYGITPFPEPGYWVRTAKEMARRVGGAAPAGIWIVGVTLDDGTCELNFPGPGSSFPNISFLAEDQNESYLSYFDSQGMSVWLQVEPGSADLPTLIDLVLGRYGRHACVVGFGVDAEWYRWTTDEWGRPIIDAEASLWSERVRAHKASYTLFLKHWLPEQMPPHYRTGLLFIDDSQEFPSLDSMIAEFRDWGQVFRPSPVGFQFGYEADRFWWSRLDDPPAVIGTALRQAVPNLRGLFWVDFTLREVFPEDAPAGMRPADRTHAPEVRLPRRPGGASAGNTRTCTQSRQGSGRR
jgi:hypothetical protein